MTMCANRKLIVVVCVLVMVQNSNQLFTLLILCGPVKPVHVHTTNMCLAHTTAQRLICKCYNVFFFFQNVTFFYVMTAKSCSFPILRLQFFFIKCTVIWDASCQVWPPCCKINSWAHDWTGHFGVSFLLNESHVNN